MHFVHKSEIWILVLISESSLRNLRYFSYYMFGSKKRYLARVAQMSVGHVVIDGENQQILGRPRKYVQLVHKISEICQSFCHTLIRTEIYAQKKRRMHYAQNCFSGNVDWKCSFHPGNAHFIQEIPVQSYRILKNVRKDIFCWKFVRPNQSKFWIRNT